MDQFTVWTAEASGTCGKIRVPVGRKKKKKVAEIMHCIVHNDHTNRFSVRLDLPTSSFSYKTHLSSTLLINTKSSLSLTL